MTSQPETPNVQLGSLNFDDIKDSIISYLKTQETLKDYDYAGSALQVLLDVLAYNTMYYGHYSNMVASEMFLDSAQRVESLISLVKPLGYVVPGKTSARGKAKVRTSGVEGSIIPAYTRFTGYNEAGTPYTFYSIQDYALNLDGEQIVEIVEAKSISREIPLIVDRNNQKGFLFGLDIDISTVTVEVLEDGKNEWRIWSKSDNIETGLDSDSTVYWLERSELGFFVVFGGNVGSSTVVQVGRQIGVNDLVRVTYLKSNGSFANEVGSWKVHGIDNAGETETISLSSGGTNEPNLDMIRFFAPKWFAAQDRAVTVEDCKALLARTGFVGDASDPHSKFNVWGGEEMDPPMYGRVFVSVNEEGTVNTEVAAERALSLLKEKTCVAIIPEFINPSFFDVRVSGALSWDPLGTSLSREQVMGTILQKLSEKYGTTRFENNISTSEISTIINAVEPSAVFSNLSNFSLAISGKVELGPDVAAVGINFGNSLQSSNLTTTEFVVGSKYSVDPDVPSGQLIGLRTIGGVDGIGRQKLEGYYQNSNNITSRLPGAGLFWPEKGEVHINTGVASEPFDVTCSPMVNSVLKMNQHRVATVSFNLNLVRI